MTFAFERFEQGRRWGVDIVNGCMVRIRSGSHQLFSVTHPRLSNDSSLAMAVMMVIRSLTAGDARANGAASGLRSPVVRLYAIIFIIMRHACAS